jgi:hypothetical protein
MAPPKYPRHGPPPRAPRAPKPPNPYRAPLFVILVVFVLAGLFFSGIFNQPAKHGKLGCTPAEIAANAPCR